MARSLVSRPWLDVARAAFLEGIYRGRAVLCVGVGDGTILEVLLARGAARVAGVDVEAAAIEAAKRRVGSRAELAVGPPSAAKGARFDVVLMAAGERVVEEREWLDGVLGRLAPGGYLVVAGRNSDGGGHGVRYFDLHNRLAPHFPSVTMLGQSPFAGSTLAPFGEEEADPVLDTELAGDVAPELYVAIAGPRRPPIPFGLISLPFHAVPEAPPPRPQAPPPAASPVRDELATLRSALADRDRRLGQVVEERAHFQALGATLREREDRLRDLELERRALVEELERRTGAGYALHELRDRLSASEQALEAAREAALAHAEEMRLAEALLAERDAYIVELERERREVDARRRDAAEAAARAADAEGRERVARRRIAELEGTLLRLEKQIAEAPPAAAADEGPLVECRRQLAELEARCEKLKTKADDAQREAWAHMKSRSDAEAAAAEVRDDAARKLKDARKIANLELMRAMEEATKKAVSLKEELVRTERERKDGVAALAAARADLEQERGAVEERVRAAAAEQVARLEQLAAAEASRVLGSLEARVLDAEAGRDRALAELATRDAVPMTGGGAGAPVGGPAPEVVTEVAAELSRLSLALERETARVGAIEAGLRGVLAARVDQGEGAAE